MRDDFPQRVKEELAKRVGYKCSNPVCRQPTSGPQLQGAGAVNVGVAAHIAGASPGGPRYDPSMTEEERKSVQNGIWLCQNHGKLVDSDLSEHTKELLLEWKETAEAAAYLEVRGLTVVTSGEATLHKIEKLMPELFSEMREDLQDNSLSREFILMQSGCIYWPDSNNPVLVYYFDKHENLRQKIRLLENDHLVRDITHNNVDRFLMSEELAWYLLGDTPS